jgi:pantothenate kinase
MEEIMYSHDRVMAVHDNMVDIINSLMEENAALKAKVAELTSHNKQSTPCLKCIGYCKSVGVSYCKACGRELPSE